MCKVEIFCELPAQLLATLNLETFEIEESVSLHNHMPSSCLNQPISIYFVGAGVRAEEDVADAARGGGPLPPRRLPRRHQPHHPPAGYPPDLRLVGGVSGC